MPADAEEPAAAPATATAAKDDSSSDSDGASEASSGAADLLPPPPTSLATLAAGRKRGRQAGAAASGGAQRGGSDGDATLAGLRAAVARGDGSRAAAALCWSATTAVSEAAAAGTAPEAGGGRLSRAWLAGLLDAVGVGCSPGRWGVPSGTAGMMRRGVALLESGGGGAGPWLPEPERGPNVLPADTPLWRQPGTTVLLGPRSACWRAVVNGILLDWTAAAGVQLVVWASAAPAPYDDNGLLPAAAHVRVPTDPSAAADVMSGLLTRLRTTAAALPGNTPLRAALVVDARRDAAPLTPALLDAARVPGALNLRLLLLGHPGGRLAGAVRHMVPGLTLLGLAAPAAGALKAAADLAGHEAKGLAAAAEDLLSASPAMAVHPALPPAPWMAVPVSAPQLPLALLSYPARPPATVMPAVLMQAAGLWPDGVAAVTVPPGPQAGRAEGAPPGAAGPLGLPLPLEAVEPKPLGLSAAALQAWRASAPLPGWGAGL